MRYPHNPDRPEKQKARYCDSGRRRTGYCCDSCQSGWEIDQQKKDEVLKATIALPSAEEAGALWRHFEQVVANVLSQPAGENLAERVVAALLEARDRLQTSFQPEYVAYVLSRYFAYLKDTDSEV